MKFLVDNQLPPALARMIDAELDSEARHVTDLGLRDASDVNIWSYASAHGLVLISKDEDFANMVLQKPTAKLIWARVGNCRRVVLLALFRKVWPRILERLDVGDAFIEVRGE